MIVILTHNYQTCIAYLIQSKTTLQNLELSSLLFDFNSLLLMSHNITTSYCVSLTDGREVTAQDA